MKERPKMYQNNERKEFHNNRNIYTSFDKSNDIQKKEIIWNSNDIRQKINQIVSANNFIYSKLVHIEIGNEVITRKIIGIFGDNLVTIDNEYIPISNIKNIYIK